MKRLKNIEDENEQLLKTTKNKRENIKEVTDFIKEPLSPEAKTLIEETKTIQKNVDYKKLKITGDFYYKKMTINDAQMKQNEFDYILLTL